MSDPKPGELWVVRCDDAEMAACYDGECEWYILATREFREATPLRRLIVLDPESADDVKRVREAIVLMGGDVGLGIVGLALRRLATPPEPEMPEPTALGTVVVDGDGAMWVLCDRGQSKYPWRLAGSASPSAWEDWRSLTKPIRLAADEERGA